MLSQVVTKTDYDYSCTGALGTRNLTHTVGVWDGLRFAVYPNKEATPIVIKETTLP